VGLVVKRLGTDGVVIATVEMQARRRGRFRVGAQRHLPGGGSAWLGGTSPGEAADL
jgi:hypothetical protein